MDYQSWQIPLTPGQILAPKPLFRTSKRDKLISQWTIIVEYALPEDPPTSIVQGVLLDIVGLANGISGISNVVSQTLTGIPLVGATYRAYGSEIQIGFNNNDVNPALNMLVSAIEDPPAVIDGETLYAEVFTTIEIPRFSTSFSVAVDGQMRQKDASGNSLFSNPVLAGQFVPIHPLAWFIEDATPQLQIYSFRKGYT